MSKGTALLLVAVLILLAASGCGLVSQPEEPSATPGLRTFTQTPSPPPSVEPIATPTPIAAASTATQVQTAPADTPSPTDTPSPVTLPSATSEPPAPQEWWQVRTLLVAPGEPGRLYALIGDLPAGFDDATTPWFLISDDYGDTWVDFPGGLPAQDCVYNVNLDYATPDALYASTCEGLYRWTGAEWRLISAQQTRMVAIVYGQPEVIWAANVHPPVGAVARSVDGGVTWARADGGLIQFNGMANVAIEPRDPNALYGIIMPKYGGSYLRRGTGDGQWKTMPTPLDNSQIGTGMTIDGAAGALYVMVKSPTSQLWGTHNPNVPDVNDVRWELVQDFGRDVDAELLASGWSPQGLALYANLWSLEWRDEGYAVRGAAVLHRSLDGGHTWTALPLPVIP